MKKTCTRIASVILALCIAAVNANITSGNVYAEGPSSSGIVLKADPSSRKIRHASESVCLMPVFRILKGLIMVSKQNMLKK